MNEFNNTPNNFPNNVPNNMPNPNMYGPMKKCKHCQCDIPAKAKICPNCKKKQGAGCLPVVLVVIGVFVLIGIVGGSGSSSKDKESDIKVEKSSVSTASSAEKETTEKTEKKDTEKNKETTKEKKEEPAAETNDRIEVKAGDSFETKELKVSINDTNTDYQVQDDEFGLYELDADHKYISVSFTFENISDSDCYVSIYDFKCYADDENCEQQYLPDDNDFINTNLSKGRKVSFTTYYSVPKNAKSIELEYTEGFFDTGETIYVIVQ